MFPLTDWATISFDPALFIERQQGQGRLHYIIHTALDLLRWIIEHVERLTPFFFDFVLYGYDHV